MSLENSNPMSANLGKLNATVKGKGAKRRELESAHMYHRDMRQSVKKKAR